MPEPVDTTQPIAPASESADDGEATVQLQAAGSGSPRLAEGVELIGQMKGSGYKEAPFMARRSDAQMVQLAPILYLVAERLDGRHNFEQIGAEVSEIVGRGLDAEGVRMLVEEKLRPLGLVAADDGSQPQVEKQDQFLGLKFKTALIPPSVVRAITVLFRPLFWGPLVVVALAAFVAFDIWFFFGHGFAESMRQIIYQPLYLLMTFAFVVLAAAFHEAGHATACRYGGAEPGAMGVGLYIVWPAFYTDVTDSYRLGKGGRLRTDLGGVYFNVVFIHAMAGIYFATGFEPLLIPVLLAHLDIFRQLLPLLRLDGYYVLSDLTGVPDLFTRIKPILASFIPWKRSDERVKELKWWVRFVVTLWVIVFVAFLLFNIGYILVFAPRIFATGWDSFRMNYEQTSTAFGSGDSTAGAAGVVKLIALGLPALGLVLGFSRGGTRITRSLWTKTRGKPFARATTVLLVAGAMGALAATWWPDGDYKPIQEGETFTVQSAAVAATQTAAGEPAFADVEPGDPGGPGGDQGPEGTDEQDPAVVPPVIEESPSPTPSASVSPTPTESASLSPSPSPSPSPSSSSSPSPSPSPSPTTEV